MSAAPGTRLALLAVVAAITTAGGIASAAAPKPADSLESARLALRMRDFPAALAKLKQGATAGNADAQLLFGLVNLNGVGTPIDKAAAADWLSRSAAQNNATAVYVLAALAANRSDAQPGESQALLHKAAALGYPAAIEDERAGRMPLSPQWAGLADATMRVELAIYSARNGDLTCLKAFGPELKQLRDPFGATVLAHAVAAGSMPSLRFLIDLGVDLNRADNFGVTPLMLAAQLEGTQALELLLAHGASVNALDNAQRTALFYAARADRAAALSVLAKAGAKLDAADSREYSALDAALTVDAIKAIAQLRTLGVRTLVAHASREGNVGNTSRAVMLPGGDLLRRHLFVGGDQHVFVRVSGELGEIVFGFIVDVFAAEPCHWNDMRDSGDRADFAAIVSGQEVGQRNAMARHDAQ